MRILGLSSFRHDSAAALLEDGNIIAAVEEAKLARSHTRGLPENAIKFCLAKAGATWHDLDAIAVSTRPLKGWARRSWGAAGGRKVFPLAGPDYAGNENAGVARGLSHLRILRPQTVTSPSPHL